MSQENKIPPEEGRPEEEPSQSPSPYASPLKRIWAWVGVVYMVIITLLVTYLFATAAMLQGIGGLMILPALGGVAASSLWMWRDRKEHTLAQGVALAVILLACAALTVLGLLDGIPALIANFGG